MSHLPSERRASRDRAKSRAAPAQARAASSRTAPTRRAEGSEKLVDMLRSAESCALIVASFLLEFEEPRAAQGFNRELAQLKRDDHQMRKHLLVRKAGRSLHVLYTPHAQNISALPRREITRGSKGELLSRGEFVRAAELADALGVTKQAISKALRDKRVFTLEIDGVRYYPSFYLDGELERRQLESVTKALGDLPGASKLQFFSTPKHSLDGATPLEALAKGKFEQVMKSARGFAER